MGFFYLLALVSYGRWRLREEEEECSRLRSIFRYGLCLGFSVLAMKTKENAFTLPLSMVAYEFLFFSGSITTRLFRFIPLSLTMLIVPLTLAGTDRTIEKMVTHIADASFFLTPGVSAKVYLLTQFRVLVTYLRLLLLPVHQNLNYNLPLYSSFFAPEVLFSFILHLGFLGLAIYCFCRSRRRLREWRVITFGILWFYITLSVESSVIPLKMIICEYKF